MDPRAKVRGTSVYSDKRGGISVVGSVVYFADGSYADVTTGEVVNKGPGSISIGGPPKGAGERTRREEKFGVRTPAGLVIRGLMVDVNLKTHPANNIVVTLEGPQSSLDLISVRQDGNTVIIEGQDGGGGGSVVVGGDFVGGDLIRVGRGTTIRTGRSVTRIGGRVGGVVVSGGGAVVMTGDAVAGGPDFSLEVTIPVQTNVEIDGVDGQVSLEDIEGSLRARVSGFGDIHGGQVQDARLKISGSGSVYLRGVNGKHLRTRISGSGSVRVESGNVEEIDCSVSGSGQINFGGVAEDGDLDVSGSGNIYVAQVVNRPSRSRRGSGSINVGNWPQKPRRRWDW